VGGKRKKSGLMACPIRGRDSGRLRRRAIVQVRDRAEAVEWATRFGALFDEVEIEVRKVSELG
jgi:hypothetical protein